MQPSQHSLGLAFTIRVFVGTRVIDAGLFEPRDDAAIFDDHRVAPGPVAKAEMVLVDQHAHPAGEVARTVREELGLADAKMLSPLVHDKGIVDREAVDLIRPRRAQIVIGAFIGGALFGAAGRGERTRQGEDDNALAIKDVGACQIVPAERVGAANRVIANAGAEGDIGNIAVDHRGAPVV